MCLQNRSFENTVGKGEMTCQEQFLLFLQCRLPVWRSFCHFHQIQSCRLQTLSIWNSLKFVLWERVNLDQSIVMFGGNWLSLMELKKNGYQARKLWYDNL